MKKGYNKCARCGRWCHADSYTMYRGGKLYQCAAGDCANTNIHLIANNQAKLKQRMGIVNTKDPNATYGISPIAVPLIRQEIVDNMVNSYIGKPKEQN